MPSGNQNGWNEYSRLVLKELETLADSIDSLRTELQEMKQELAKIHAREDKIEDLKIWEDTIKYDLEPLFLEEQIPASLTEEFQDNAYRNIAIRYMNFPGPDLSIDYALAANKLVITTSRESMYAAIDVLLGD